MTMHQAELASFDESWNNPWSEIFQSVRDGIEQLKRDQLRVQLWEWELWDLDEQRSFLQEYLFNEDITVIDDKYIPYMKDLFERYIVSIEDDEDRGFAAEEFYFFFDHPTQISYDNMVSNLWLFGVEELEQWDIYQFKQIYEQWDEEFAITQERLDEERAASDKAFAEHQAYIQEEQAKTVTLEERLAALLAEQQELIRSRDLAEMERKRLDALSQELQGLTEELEAMGIDLSDF